MKRLTINTSLNFDDSDDYIVDKLLSLKDQHKVGDFLVYCVKNYSKEQEYSNKNQVAEQLIVELQNKINAIWDMALKTYGLLEIGKRVGLEKSPKNLMLSSYLLNRELNKIQELLNIDITSIPDKSITQQADDIIEYIIHSYDGLLGEIKTLQTDIINIQSSQSASEQVTEKPKEPVDVEQGQEVPKKFGENEDLSDLMDFCGI
jgi:hypothetical protein